MSNPTRISRPRHSPPPTDTPTPPPPYPRSPCRQIRRPRFRFPARAPGIFPRITSPNSPAIFSADQAAVGDHRHIGLARRFAAEHSSFHDTMTREFATVCAWQLPAGDRDDQRAGFDPFRFDHWRTRTGRQADDRLAFDRAFRAVHSFDFNFEKCRSSPWRTTRDALWSS